MINLNDISSIGILPGVKVAIANMKDGSTHRLTKEELKELKKLGKL